MSEAERDRDEQLARNLGELLQELRVMQAGVQILFGFLLSIAFTERYASANAYIRATHLVTVAFATASVAFLTAPAAWHRLLFRLGRREQIIRSANVFSVIGLVCLALAMTGTVLLLAEVIVGRWWAELLGVLALLLFAMLWFALPWRERMRGPAPERMDDPDRTGVIARD
jgi:Family of unknown function (DUF6328)